MSKIGKRLIIAVVVVVAIMVAGRTIVMNNQTAQDWLAEQALARVLGQNNDTYGGDKIDVVFCGTASPMGRGRAQSCTAVLAGDKFFIIDSGARSTDVLTGLGLPVGRLDAVFLTHFHSDHIASLGELHLASWARGRDSKMHVYGGPGVDQVVDGFNMAYGLDYGYRTGHHGEAIMPSKTSGLKAHRFTAPAKGMITVYQDGDVTVSAFRVNHPPIEPSYGYRIDYRGRSVVISGDTTKDGNLIAAAHKTDVLVHEVLQPYLVRLTSETLQKAGQEKLGQLIMDTLDYHTAPVEAAAAANEADVGLLVFSHYAPVPQNPLVERIFMRGVDEVRKQGVFMATDGTHIELPALDDGENDEKRQIIVN